jgi:hypothetical protein
LQSKAIAIENDLRATLRNFGLKVGMVGKVRFEERIRELVENRPDRCSQASDLAEGSNRMETPAASVRQSSSTSALSTRSGVSSRCRVTPAFIGSAATDFSLTLTTMSCLQWSPIIHRRHGQPRRQ